ncbi:MAG TPA: hypothetical protein VGK48_16910 [Terriglobia bacterium]|jgi:hypothetical protein
MNDKKEELRRRLQELLPRLEEQGRRREQLRNDIRELQAELAERRENEGPPPWPGALEPLVLAAVLLVPAGDLDNIAEKAMELSSSRYGLPEIRSTVHRLVQRKFLSENDRSFTITPQGERELAQARDDAKRWIDALGNWTAT